MSKINTYFKLVKDGLPNIDKIIEGNLNNLKEELDILSEEETKEIARRRAICESCPLYSLNAKKDDSAYRSLFGFPFEYDSLREKYCGSCGCPISVKTASLTSNCGLEAYNNDHPNNKQPLLWEKFK